MLYIMSLVKLRQNRMIFLAYHCTSRLVPAPQFANEIDIIAALNKRVNVGRQHRPIVFFEG
jgi:hypothetical protein